MRAFRSNSVNLAEAYPTTVTEFVANLTNPGAGPDQIPCRAQDLCRWRCHRGHVWETRVANRTRYGLSGCTHCSRPGRSRFEDEFAALLTAATGLVVDTDVRLHPPGSRPARVDLYIPELQLYIELDPARWHARTGSAERDAAKSRRLLDAGYEVIRLRTDKLTPVDVPFIPVRGQAPWTWVGALASTVKDRGAN